MTVRELIELLKQEDPDATVDVFDAGSWYGGPAVEVYRSTDSTITIVSGA